MNSSTRRTVWNPGVVISGMVEEFISGNRVEQRYQCQQCGFIGTWAETVVHKSTVHGNEVCVVEVIYVWIQD